MSVSVDGSSVALHYRSGTGKLVLMNELYKQWVVDGLAEK